MLQFENLEPAEIKQRLDSGEKLRIIDVRESHEWKICSIPGADQLPLCDFRYWQEEIRTEDGPYVFYSHYGDQSLYVCLLLSRRGVKGLINMVGGISAWSKTVDPSVPTY